MTASTAIIWDGRYLGHQTGPGHPESPARLKAIKEVLDTDPSLISLAPRRATPEEIAWVHTPSLIHSVEESSRQGLGYFDMDTPFSPGSAEAAFLAAGGVLSAIDAVEEGKVSNAFAFPRPPGHHAEKDKVMGFCLFNNVAVGAEYLIRQKGKSRVAIVDIDVHHGNGTQHSFYDRDDVFYFSTHRFPFYPGTGARSEKGRGKGEGYTLNVPFIARADDDDFKEAYEEEIVPALLDYKPDFILVSAGFDAHQRDPLGGLNVSKKGFEMMAKNLLQVAQKSCGGKIIFVLEGGYDMKGLQEGVEAVLETIHS